MRIAIGSDHAGYRLKEQFIAVLKEGGHDVNDLGTDSEAAVDYPIYCSAVGREVAAGRAERGIVLGGSGQGEQSRFNLLGPDMTAADFRRALAPLAAPSRRRCRAGR